MFEYYTPCEPAARGAPRKMEKSIHTKEYAVLLRLLREVRKKAGITQVKLARELGETQSSISKIERGDRRVDVIELRAICQVIGTTLPEFISELERRLASAKKRGDSS